MIVLKLSYRYLLVGIWNSLFGILAFAIILKIAGVDRHQLALALGYVVAILQSHLTQRRYVWKSKTPYFTELLKFSALYLVQYPLNVLGLLVLVDLFGMKPIIAQSGLTFLLTLGLFFTNKLFIFRVRRKSE